MERSAIQPMDSMSMTSSMLGVGCGSNGPYLLLRWRNEDKRFGFGDPKHKRLDFELRSSEHDRSEIDPKNTSKFPVIRSVSSDITVKASLRILGDDLGSINNLDIENGSLEEVLQDANSMFRGFALPKGCQVSRPVVRDPVTK